MDAWRNQGAAAEADTVEEQQLKWMQWGSEGEIFQTFAHAGSCLALDCSRRRQ